MTRDDEYIRNLLLGLEKAETPYFHVSTAININKEKLKERYHVQLMCDAGMIIFHSKSGYRLSNQGHDYIEAIKNDTVWQKTKEGAAKVGGATLGMMKDMAIAYLRQEAAEKLGIKL